MMRALSKWLLNKISCKRSEIQGVQNKTLFAFSAFESALEKSTSLNSKILDEDE